MEAKLGEGGAVLEDYPQARAANRMQVDTLIRLANEYPDIVPVITVGNETQVFWSAHKVPADTLIRYIREVRAATKVPVATADDFNYWNKPESRTVAREIDFIVTHIYAMWAGQPLDRALPFTQEKYAEVAQMHPGFVIVLGEAGWATQKHNEGEQAKLIKGEAGEEQQKTFYDQFVAWTTREKIANFYFEAFDESWKGGPNADEVEKHWGLFRADRTPKLALQDAK
jgi:exo-beta-1,3-glucanase (GH17 family)